MKRLLVILLTLAQAMQSMEPKMAEELKLMRVAKHYLEGTGRWVRLVEEVLPGYIPPPVLSGQHISPETRISQVIAQEILRQGPPVRQLILDKISMLLRAYLRHTKASRSTSCNLATDYATSSADLEHIKIQQFLAEDITHLQIAILNDILEVIRAREYIKAFEKKVFERDVLSILASLKNITFNFNNYPHLWDHYASLPETIRTIFDPYITKLYSSPEDEIVQNGAPIRQYILSIVSLPFIECAGHTGKINSATFNQAGTLMVTGSSDTTAKLWDTKTGKLLLTLIGHTQAVNSALFNQAGTRLVTCSDDTTARLWDTKSGTLLHILKGHPEAIVSAIFDPTGDNIVTGSDDDTARIWDTKTGNLLHILQGRINVIFSGLFSPKGDKVITIGVWDRTAKIWHTKTGELILTLKGHDGILGSALFSPTGDKIITGSYDTTARIWDAETGKLIHILEGHNDVVLYVQFNQTGDKVITAGSWDKTAKLWDTKTGILLHNLGGHTGIDRSLEFNPSGDKILTHSKDKTTRIWDTKTGKLIRTLEEDPRIIRSILLTPTGNKIITGFSNNAVKIGDLEPLLSSEKFLAEDITPRQKAVLYDLFISKIVTVLWLFYLQ